MHDDWYTKLRGLGPERIVLRQSQILTADVSADGGTAQTEAFDAILQLLHTKSGCCNATDAIATNRSGWEDTHLASPSFCFWTMRRASSRSVTAYHQKPLMVSA
jgi:hypothetical protein